MTENEQAIWNLEQISLALKDQVCALDKLAKVEKVPPHYVVELANIARELLEHSRSLPLGR